MPEITKVAYGLTIGDLKYGNSRPGVVEANLRPGETMEAALDELDERLNAWHRKRYPHLYEMDKILTEQIMGDPYLRPPRSSSPMPIIDRSSKEKLEIAIDNADSPETLSTLKEEASKHNLVSLYMERLRQLTQ